MLSLQDDIQRIALTCTDTNAIPMRIFFKAGAEQTGAAVGPFVPLGQSRLSVSSGALLVDNASDSGLDDLRASRAGNILLHVNFAAHRRERARLGLDWLYENPGANFALRR